MMRQFTLTLPPYPKGVHLIQEQVLGGIDEMPETGIMHVFIQHTSAALSIGENADPTVRQDLDQAFDRVAPEDAGYFHDAEGPDDMPAHVKSVLIGSSVSIPISNGRLNLGRWQGIYLCEFRTHASSRTFVVTVMA